jgi:uncharacterized membrane protein
MKVVNLYILMLVGIVLILMAIVNIVESLGNE